MKLLLAKEVNKELDGRTQKTVRALASRGVTPALAIVRVGEDPDDIFYENSAERCCRSLGIGVIKKAFAADAGTDELVSEVSRLSADPQIHGILVMRPLPSHIDEDAVRAAILPAKDVDGATYESEVAFYKGMDTGYAPCVACSVVELLRFYGVDPGGKRVAVIGRSAMIGKPIAMLLLSMDATVTICHSKTTDVPAVCREADIIVSAAGRARMVGREFFSQGQTVIDVGINVDEAGNMCGDVDTAAAETVVDAITPVPGGIGGITTHVLAAHVADAAMRLSGGRDNE